MATVEQIVKATLEGLQNNYEEQQYVDGLKTREIYFNEQVDFGIINRIVHNIFKWNREDDLANLEGENRPEVTLHLTSEGGCVVSMFSLINAIQSSKTKIVGKAYGMVASAGAYIFIACHERHIQKDSTVLLHAGGINLQGEANAAKQTMKHYGEYDKRVKEMVLDRTKITPQLYAKRAKDEWYEHGNKCVELGIADYLM
jgi:ATP-dependent protease ClpP protease subunit